ncbi:DUF2232 domain-containing protein [Defluviitalea phaphyphila]|uniref:DUF2232 domain-containing protein n=1 Tax=Defluviitalea phaphyphila TaxID=1473580 RepID=UPI0007302F2E|nr:DUF2232 domain-containing protein [Defluviitalea phaphyphila]
MKLNIKEILLLIVIGLFYIWIGSFGYGFLSIYFFSSLLGIPFILYVYKKGLTAFSFLIPLIVISYLIINGMHKEAIITLLIIFIPSFLCGIYYNKQKSLSKNIVIVSIGYLCGYIGILILWNILYNIDIISELYVLLDFFQSQYIEQFTQKYNILIQNVDIQIDSETLKQIYINYRFQIKQAVYLMKYLFPSIIFIFGFFTSIFQVLFVKLILKILNWKAPSIKEITNIGFTPITIIVLGFTWLFRTGIDKDYYPYLSMIIDNVLIIFSVLIFIIGILFIVHIIKNSKTSIGIKIFISIFSIISVIFSPLLFIILGSFEALFNFRKTERFL